MELIEKFDAIVDVINNYSIDDPHQYILCQESSRMASHSTTNVIKPFVIKPSPQTFDLQEPVPKDTCTEVFYGCHANQKSVGNLQNIFHKDFPTLLIEVSTCWNKFSDVHQKHIISVLTFQTLPHLLNLAKTFSVPFIELDEATAGRFEDQFDFFQDLATQTQHFIALH